MIGLHDNWLVLCFSGDQFALSEAIVALAMLMRRFELRMDPEAPPVSMTTVCSYFVKCTCLL